MNALTPPTGNAITRDDFGHKSADMCNELSMDLHILMMSAFDAMTDDERAALSDDSRPYLLVRAIGMAVGARALSDRFDVAAIEKLTPRVKRILTRRGW